MTAHSTRPLLALQDRLQLRERIEMVLRLGDSSVFIGHAVFASSWQELACLGERHPGSPALVDPSLVGFSDTTSEELTPGGRRDWSSTPLILYAERNSPEHGTRPPGFSFTARVRAGLVDDDIDALDAAIMRSIDVRRVHLLLERLGRCADPFAHRVLRHALELAIGPATVSQIVGSLRMPRRTLQRRCAVLGIPGPQTLISLARVFTVERLSKWSSRPAGAIALALGFSHRANYRRLTRRLLGVPPSILEERGGADYVEEVIVRAVDLRGSASVTDV